MKIKYSVTMIPTPRELSASCGLSLMLESDVLESVSSDLKEQGFEGMHLYRVTRDESGTRRYKELEWRC